MKKSQTIAIYGAQGIALGTYNAIKTVYPEKNILCFVITQNSENTSTLGGIPVKELSDFSASLTIEEKDSISIWIATPETVMDEIENLLRKEHFTNIERIDSMRWAELQELAFKKNKLFTPLSDYPTGKNKAAIEIFIAKFWKDKALKNKITYPDYFTPLQVGAANTDKIIADILDSDGDNISHKNSNYSELTALYWIWKNKLTDNNYYGLGHYRRYLSLSDDDLYRLVDNNIDVILPYPMPYEPNIEAHHKRYLSFQEWQSVLTAMNELHPAYIDDFKTILKQNYLYNYNIIIAKGEVLKEYCNWLFPLLEQIEKNNDPNNENIPNRYIGYIGETLETIFFMKNKKKFKIAYTGCKFLI